MHTIDGLIPLAVGVLILLIAATGVGFFFGYQIGRKR